MAKWKRMKNSLVYYWNEKNEKVQIMMMIVFITIIIATFIIHKCHYNTDTIFVVVVVALLITGFSWYISSTEKGKRIVKDFTSNVSGGIHRHVKAYDINWETENQAIYWNKFYKK